MKNMIRNFVLEVLSTMTLDQIIASEIFLPVLNERMGFGPPVLSNARISQSLVTFNSKSSSGASLTEGDLFGCIKNLLFRRKIWK